MKLSYSKAVLLVLLVGVAACSEIEVASFASFMGSHQHPLWNTFHAPRPKAPAIPSPTGAIPQVPVQFNSGSAPVSTPIIVESALLLPVLLSDPEKSIWVHPFPSHIARPFLAANPRPPMVSKFGFKLWQFKDLPQIQAAGLAGLPARSIPKLQIVFDCSAGLKTMQAIRLLAKGGSLFIDRKRAETGIPMATWANFLKNFNEALKSGCKYSYNLSEIQWRV